MRKSDVFSVIYVDNEAYGITSFDVRESPFFRSPFGRTVRQLLNEHLALPNFKAIVSLLEVESEFRKIAVSAFAIFIVHISSEDMFRWDMETLDRLKEIVKLNKPGADLYTCNILVNQGKKIDQGFAEKQKIIDLYYQPMRPSPALSRLIEFIHRVTGEGDNFPNYTFKELRKIAAHINQENFNFGTPRADAIPKYEIGPNGRPVIL